MEYRVIKFFTDLKDHNHPYNVGDIYPRKGLTVSDARIKELSGNKNKQGTPLIEKVSITHTPATLAQSTEAVQGDSSKEEVARQATSEVTETQSSEGRQKRNRKNKEN